jgi:nucleolar pre-ribosomal-associated protein 1
VSDQRILSIFTLFERQRKLSVRGIVARWAPSSSSLAGAVANGGSVGLEALQNLDPILVLRTALSFPVWRNLGDIIKAEDLDSGRKGGVSHEAQLYDPNFILLLLHHALSNGPPTSAIAWIELFRSNVVGLALRALSAKDGKVRELGMGSIVALWTLMQNADLQERDYVVYLLALLKNAIFAPSHDANKMNVNADEGIYPPRLPSYITLLLFHSLRGIFNPSTFVYPLTSRFLLQRPELDVTDVPMLYSMLYSSDSEDWKKERGWIIRFLADGALTGSAVGDWRLLKRRHVWDLIASMYQPANSSTSAFSPSEAGGQSSSGGDRALKQGVLEFLVNVTRHRGPTLSLVLKSGLLAWIEMQLNCHDHHSGNGVEWLKILENVSVVVDVKKLEAGAYHGQWASTVGRCVRMIVEHAVGESRSLLLSPLVAENVVVTLASPSSLSTTLPLATRIALRLSSVGSTTRQNLAPLLSECLTGLRILEVDVKPSARLPPSTPILQFDDLVPPPQHSSHILHDQVALDEESLFFLWGRCVESLWRATMNVDMDTTTSRLLWNAFTSRILLWRKAVGEDASPLGEWARVECIRNMGSSP